jgi:hypothetical protein
MLQWCDLKMTDMLGLYDIRDRNWKASHPLADTVVTPLLHCGHTLVTLLSHCRFPSDVESVQALSSTSDSIEIEKIGLCHLVQFYHVRSCLCPFRARALARIAL